MIKVDSTKFTLPVVVPMSDVPAFDVCLSQRGLAPLSVREIDEGLFLYILRISPTGLYYLGRSVENLLIAQFYHNN